MTLHLLPIGVSLSTGRLPVDGDLDRSRPSGIRFAREIASAMERVVDVSVLKSSDMFRATVTRGKLADERSHALV